MVPPLPGNTRGCGRASVSVAEGLRRVASGWPRRMRRAAAGDGRNGSAGGQLASVNRPLLAGEALIVSNRLTRPPPAAPLAGRLAASPPRPPRLLRYPSRRALHGVPRVRASASGGRPAPPRVHECSSGGPPGSSALSTTPPPGPPPLQRGASGAAHDHTRLCMIVAGAGERGGRAERQKSVAAGARAVTQTKRVTSTGAPGRVLFSL